MRLDKQVDTSDLYALTKVAQETQTMSFSNMIANMAGENKSKQGSSPRSKIIITQENISFDDEIEQIFSLEVADYQDKDERIEVSKEN